MKRVLLWALAIVALLALAVVLAFRLSPWPSVALVEYMFAKGDAASDAALEKHVPPGVSARRDIAYGAGGADERLDLFRPDAAAGPLPAIVWVHGGAWVAGSKDAVANYLQVLAAEGYATVGVEYSTGFGATYPKPVAQVNAALAFLTAHAAELGIDPGRIVLAGDSAGAQLAAQTALIVTDPAYAELIGIAPGLAAGQLRGVLLLSGAFDIDAVDYDGPFGWFSHTVLWAYSGVKDFLDDERFRLMSVTNHVGPGFPPAFISSGNGDPLLKQAEALAGRLEGLGARVDSLFFPPGTTPPLPHEYQFDLDRPEGRQALARMRAFLAGVLAPGH